MGRKLEFNSEEELSKKRFEFLFQGLMIWGSINNQKGLATLKRELSLLQKFEDVSEPMPCGKKIPNLDEADRRLIKGEHTVEISDAEFDLLYTYVSSVPWQIGKSSRTALEALEWIKTCASSNSRTM